MIPNYIKNSELYESLQDDKIDTKYILQDDFKIDTLHNLSKILDVCRFWGVYELPWEIYDFIYENLELDYGEVLSGYDDFDKIDDIKVILEYYNNPDFSKIMVFTINKPHEYKQSSLPLLRKIFKSDNVDIFKWFEKKETFQDLDDYDFCIYSSRYGSIACLKYLIKQEYTLKGNCCEMAIDFNHLECLKLLHINKAKWTTKEIESGISRKSIECVEYLKNKKCLYEEDTKDFKKQCIISYSNINYSSNPICNYRFGY